MDLPATARNIRSAPLDELNFSASPVTPVASTSAPALASTRLSAGKAMVSLIWSRSPKLKMSKKLQS